jgi:hypothetical protein
MIPDAEMIELMRLDLDTLKNQITRQIAMAEDLRTRLFKALVKNLLMETLLTMDVPRGRIKLSESNIQWLLRNVQINNSNHADLERVIRLLKEMVNADGSN